MNDWTITTWFDGFRWVALFCGATFFADTEDAAFALAYAAKCEAAGI